MWKNNFDQMKSRSAVDLRSTETDFEKAGFNTIEYIQLFCRMHLSSGPISSEQNACGVWKRLLIQIPEALQNIKIALSGQTLCMAVLWQEMNPKILYLRKLLRMGKGDEENCSNLVI